MFSSLTQNLANAKQRAVEAAKERTLAFAKTMPDRAAKFADWQGNAAQNFLNNVPSIPDAYDSAVARTKQGLGSIRTGATAQLAKLAPAVDNTLSGIKTTLQTLFGSIRDSATLQSVLTKWNELDSAIRAQLGSEIQAADVPYPPPFPPYRPAAGRKRTRRAKRKNRKH